MSKNKPGERIWEIDFLRGFALLLMVIFHFIWDLREFYAIPIAYQEGFIYYMGRLAAFLFIFITGMSCTFSRNNLRRGAKIMAVAMVITLATLWYDPSTFIFFGILHFLGINIWLYTFYRRLSQPLLLLGAVIMVGLGTYFLTLSPSHNYLFFLGLTGPQFSTLDYFPLLPYSGFFLAGIYTARSLYKKPASLFAFRWEKNIITRAGRHTLLIYLLHQPVILALLYIFFTVREL